MTMNEPVEAGHNEADNASRIDGIVAQTKADLGSGHVSDLREALRQRFEDASIAVSDEQLDQLTAGVG